MFVVHAVFIRAFFSAGALGVLLVGVVNAKIKVHAGS